jgi:hypothetical protein
VALESLSDTCLPEITGMVADSMQTATLKQRNVSYRKMKTQARRNHFSMRLWHYWPAAACQLDGHQRGQGKTGQHIQPMSFSSSSQFQQLLTDTTVLCALHHLIRTNWNICAGLLHRCSHTQCFRLEEQDTVSTDGICQTEGSSQRLKVALQGMQQHAEQAPLLQPSPQCIQ